MNHNNQFITNVNGRILIVITVIYQFRHLPNKTPSKSKITWDIRLNWTILFTVNWNEIFKKYLLINKSLVM